MTDSLDSQPKEAEEKEILDLFARAVKLSSTVPESMQQAAFTYAAGRLAGQPTTAQPERVTQSNPRLARPAAGSVDLEKVVEMALQKLDRTKYPRIGAATKVLDNSLWVLRGVKDELGVDGLSPSQIAEILTDKFRVATTSAAVNMALGRAGNMVDRVPRGRGFAYRIMAPGEAYLDAATGRTPASR